MKIDRDCGGPVCWCGRPATQHDDTVRGFLNSPSSDAEHIATTVETLRLAVPLHIAEIRHQIRTEGLTQDHISARLDRATDTLGAYGDALLFTPGPVSRSRHRTAQAFNTLAYGLAVAAMQPGGIHYGGVHWEATT